MSAQISPNAPIANDTAPAVQAFTRLLRAYAASTRLLSASLQAEHGLTINDYEALLLLSRADGKRMRRVDLSRSLVLTPSGVTRLLEGLERAGLVRRTACESDLRVAYAELTDAGSARLEAASCSHVGSIRELFDAHLTAGEVVELAELLAKLPDAAAGDESCAAG